MHYEILHAMGIEQWQASDFACAFCAKEKNNRIIFDNFIFGPKVLAVLPLDCESSVFDARDSELKKITYGMLSVLNLNKKNNEIMLARIYSANKIDNNEIENKIKNLKPKNIIYFGEKLNTLTSLHPKEMSIYNDRERAAVNKVHGINLQDSKFGKFCHSAGGMIDRRCEINPSPLINEFVVHHPYDLIKNKELKKQAFSILLAIKNKIH